MHTTPWYKQFWPWFLIAVPLSSIIVGIVVVNLATNTQDSLVKDDYYKQGKAINQDLGRVKRAREMQISGSLAVFDDSVALSVASLEPLDGAAMTLEFFHPTLADRDFSLLLTRAADGVYRADLTQPLTGKWRLSLLPFDKTWKVQQTIALPQRNPVHIAP